MTTHQEALASVTEKWSHVPNGMIAAIINDYTATLAPADNGLASVTEMDNSGDWAHTATVICERLNIQPKADTHHIVSAISKLTADRDRAEARLSALEALLDKAVEGADAKARDLRNDDATRRGAGYAATLIRRAIQEARHGN